MTRKIIRAIDETGNKHILVQMRWQMSRVRLIEILNEIHVQIEIISNLEKECTGLHQAELKSRLLQAKLVNVTALQQVMGAIVLQLQSLPTKNAGVVLSQFDCEANVQ
jgi:hypothetical protein